LYKVYRIPFQRSSPIFETMFSLPQADEGDTEGKSDALPIRLDGVAKAEFDALVQILCPA